MVPAARNGTIGLHRWRPQAVSLRPRTTMAAAEGAERGGHERLPSGPAAEVDGAGQRDVAHVPKPPSTAGHERG